MDTITLNAEPRETGKRAARAARRAEHVPCVLYGHHVDPVAFQVEEKALKPLIFTDETHVVTVELGSDAWDCILKAIDFHPVTDRPMHADFQVLQAGEKVTLTVPIQFIGTPKGQNDGGRTNYVLNEITVSCLPKDIPSHLDIDVSQMEIGDALHVGDLETENLELHASPEQTLVTVVPPRVEIVEEEEDLLLEGEEGAEAPTDEADGDEAADADEE